MPQKCAHHTAVRDGHDRLAKVSRGQFVKAGDNAVQLLTRAFAPRNDMVQTPGFQEPVFVRKILFNPGDEQVLKHAEMSLAQSRVRVDLMTRGLSDARRRLPGPAEIAAVKPCELDGGQPIRQSARLGPPELSERAVKLALVTAFKVPGCFAVTKQDDAGAGHVRGV